MAVKVHETGYGKWKVPVIIIAVIVVLSLAGTGILLSDSLGVSIEEGSKRIEVAEGDGTSSVAKLLKDNGIIKYPLLFKVQSKLGGYDGNFQPGAATIDDGMNFSGVETKASRMAERVYLHLQRQVFQVPHRQDLYYPPSQVYSLPHRIISLHRIFHAEWPSNSENAKGVHRRE